MQRPESSTVAKGNASPRYLRLRREVRRRHWIARQSIPWIAKSTGLSTKVVREMLRD